MLRWILSRKKTPTICCWMEIISNDLKIRRWLGEICVELQRGNHVSPTGEPSTVRWLVWWMKGEESILCVWNSAMLLSLLPTLFSHVSSTTMPSWCPWCTLWSVLNWTVLGISDLHGGTVDPPSAGVRVIQTRVVDKPDGSAALSRGINRLDKLTDRNLMEINKDNCKVLPLWRNNYRHQHSPSSWKEKTPEVLVGTKLDIRQ